MRTLLIAKNLIEKLIVKFNDRISTESWALLVPHGERERERERESYEEPKSLSTSRCIAETADSSSFRIPASTGLDESRFQVASALLAQ